MDAVTVDPLLGGVRRRMRDIRLSVEAIVTVSRCCLMMAFALSGCSEEEDLGAENDRLKRQISELESENARLEREAD